ncbi:MAG: hypothetical protein E7170_01145 [Firmicutes bacterium]|nr:hypothetical protein [Bacillota bacterium]
MTDIHSHILFDVDDGAKSIEESIEILKKMYDIGFRNVICTPHYIEDSSYCVDNKEKLEKFNLLKSELKKQNIDINLCLGNEIFINKNIHELIESNNIYTLNNTNYILVEFPFHNQILNVEDIIHELSIKGYTTVIAHPERYSYFQDNYAEVDRLRKEGFLFQGNYASILGHYNKKSQKLLKYMLKKGYIDFLATDIHRIHRTYTIDNFDKIEKSIIKITKKDYYEKIKNNSDLICKV